MANPTRSELLAMLAGSVALTAWMTRVLAEMPDETLPTIPTTPAPTFNNRNITLSVDGVTVAPGQREALVPVSLSAPANQTMVVKFLTQNSTAKEGSDFSRAEGWLVFHPSEQTKIVTVPIKSDLGTKQLRLIVGWPVNNPTLTIAKGTAIITGGVAMTPISVEVKPLPVRPLLKQVFVEDFTAFKATDTGTNASGKPCWRSRPIHGRTQPGNNELGFYADPVVNPGTTPWGKDSFGKFFLQAESVPTGVPKASGGVEPYTFTASMITSDKLMSIKRGDYFEARMTMPQTIGSWPAFWIAPNDGSWPSIELDVFEGFFSGSGGMSRVGTTVHWKNAKNEHEMLGSMLPYLSVDLTLPHTWGCYWGDKQITFYCDDNPYFAVPNVFPDKECHMMLNVAVGGLAGKPNLASFPVKMPIDWVKVWR